MKKRVVRLLAGVVCAGMLVSETSVNVEAAASDYSNRVDKSEIYRLLLEKNSNAINGNAPTFTSTDVNEIRKRAYELISKLYSGEGTSAGDFPSPDISGAEIAQVKTTDGEIYRIYGIGYTGVDEKFHVKAAEIHTDGGEVNILRNVVVEKLTTCGYEAMTINPGASVPLK